MPWQQLPGRFGFLPSACHARNEAPRLYALSLQSGWRTGGGFRLQRLTLALLVALLLVSGVSRWGVESGSGRRFAHRGDDWIWNDCCVIRLEGATKRGDEKRGRPSCLILT